MESPLEMSHVQLSSSALERLVARRTFPLHKRTSVCRNLFGPVDHDELSQDMKAKMREISEHDQQRWNFDFEADTPLDGDYKWEEVPVESTPAFYQESVQTDRTRVTVSPAKQTPSPDSAVPRTPRMDVMERLAMPESSSPVSPTEVNQENRTDKLNSGKLSHRQGGRRKRTATTDNNTHIPGERKICHEICGSSGAPGALGVGAFTVPHPCVISTRGDVRVLTLFLPPPSLPCLPTDFFAKRRRSSEGKCNDASACHHSKSPIPVEHTPRKRIR